MGRNAIDYPPVSLHSWEGKIIRALDNMYYDLDNNMYYDLDDNMY